MNRLADAIPGVVRDLLRAAPLSPGKVAFAWKMTAGAALERAASVVLEEQTIVVTVATKQWARELHRATPMILRKLERYLGAGAVTTIEVHLGLPEHSSLPPAPGTQTQEPRTPHHGRRT